MYYKFVIKRGYFIEADSCERISQLEHLKLALLLNEAVQCIVERIKDWPSVPFTQFPIIRRSRMASVGNLDSQIRRVSEDHQRQTAGYFIDGWLVVLIGLSVRFVDLFLKRCYKALVCLNFIKTALILAVIVAVIAVLTILKCMQRGSPIYSTPL